MLALVQSSSRDPKSNDFWKMRVTTGASSAAHSFSIAFGMLSGPEDLEMLRFF